MSYQFEGWHTNKLVQDTKKNKSKGNLQSMVMIFNIINKNVEKSGLVLKIFIFVKLYFSAFINPPIRFDFAAV